jgi:hypothetical protein
MADRKLSQKKMPVHESLLQRGVRGRMGFVERHAENCDGAAA